MQLLSRDLILSWAPNRRQAVFSNVQSLARAEAWVLFAVLLFTVLSRANAYGAEPVLVDEATKKIGLGLQLNYLEDKETTSPLTMCSSQMWRRGLYRLKLRRPILGSV